MGATKKFENSTSILSKFTYHSPRSSQTIILIKILSNYFMTSKILFKDPPPTLFERPVELLQFQAKKETKQYIDFKVAT
jgi:hypothetical protein